MRLIYGDYIEYVKKNKNASDETIENYKNAVKTCGLDCFDSEKTPDVWKTLLSKLEDGVSYGAVRIILIMTKAALKLHGLSYVKDLVYNTLVAKLAKAGTIPGAYTEDQVRDILKMCQKEDWNLFRICILGAYSGLRITACKGVKFTDFKRIELAYNDVEGYVEAQDPVRVKPQKTVIYAYVVTSKGKKYVAAISEYAYKLLVDTNFANSLDVIEQDTSWKGKFRHIYRTRYIYALKKNAMAHVLKGKQPFHGFRKFFAQQLGKSELHAEDVKLLMGHAPETIAWRIYIDEVDPAMYVKVAKLYAQTPLNELRLI